MSDEFKWGLLLLGGNACTSGCDNNYNKLVCGFKSWPPRATVSRLLTGPGRLSPEGRLQAGWGGGVLVLTAVATAELAACEAAAQAVSQRWLLLHQPRPSPSQLPLPHFPVWPRGAGF